MIISHLYSGNWGQRILLNDVTSFGSDQLCNQPNNCEGIVAEYNLFPLESDRL